MKQKKTKVTPGAHHSFRGIAAILILLAASLVKGADYSGTVIADGPLAYYRFGDDTNRSPINRNSGSLGATGNATNDLPTGVVHSFPGALAGDGNSAVFFDFSTRTEIPWNAALNPTNDQPFTIEAWFYPASDQINAGQCPINNRYAPSGADRQGWVFFQRAPNQDYVGKPGFEGVGWNCRMYRGSGGSSGLDVVSQVPYEIGKWTHVVVVYDPVDPVSNATLTIYINGVAANTNTWTGGTAGTDPGYVANSNDHADAAAALAIGNYNNTAGTSLNPYFGGVDEFALYSAKLTPAQILAHYQNGTNVNRGTPYDVLIKSLNPVAYLRLDEIAPGSDVAINMGDLRSSGNGTHTTEVRHPATSALAGRTDDGAAAYHYRNGNSTTTIPWTAANNPGAGVPFTFETWLRPMSDRQGGQAAFNNRWVGGTGRTGWVVFQRDPNLSYASIPGTEGHGWEFRMYSGVGNGGQDVRTETDYTIGQWGHFVVTWVPETDNADPGGNGNNQWQGILTAYFNGVAVSSNTAALYAANLETTETAAAPADLAVGSYNAASTLGNNPFEGDIDEVAIYTNYVLTAAQILAHYQAGTNSRPATNYETLVLTAPYDGAGTQRQGPPTYLRFNDRARYPASNTGTLGYVADGNLIRTTNQAAGPQSPLYAGFESMNVAVPLDGLKSWASLNNPPGLNVSGQVTLEAWVKPGATQGDSARILSHGPPTLSAFLSDPTPETNASVLHGSEVFLRIDGAGATYVVGSSDGTNTYSASYAVPAGDLGGTSWIYLAGTYDGANWKLYRNGAPVATNASAVGALPVNNADWAIGATGNGWSNNFAGSVDEVAIYSRALTPSQVQAHYIAGQAPPSGDQLYDDPSGGWTYVLNGSSATAGPGGTNFTSLDGTWSHDNGSDTWDGSAIGGTFAAGSNAPGGVSSIDGYLRIEDSGDPRPAFPDPGNRKIYFGHNITAEGASGTVLNDGVTLHFRARISTAGLLDDRFITAQTNYPSGGDGYLIHDNGKGNFGIKQANGGIISFSLATSVDTPLGPGLVMNNRNGTANSADVDTGEAGTANVVKLDPTRWHEFWITIRADTTGQATHRVDVYLDGSLVPRTSYVTAGTGDDFAGISYIATGCGSTAQSGAFDLDYFTYKLGAVAPAGSAVPVIVSASLVSGNLLGTWVGGRPPYTVQAKSALTDPEWLDLVTFTNTSAPAPISGSSAYFRVANRVVFNVSLNGANERTNQVITPATGSGTLTLDGNKLTVDVSYTGLTANLSGVHFHGPATAEENAGVIINLQPLNIGTTSGSIRGSVTMTAQQVRWLLNGLLYMNIHTGNNPDGEIRGQVPAVQKLQFVGRLNGANERPAPIATSGQGAATLILDNNQLKLDLNYYGLSGAPTAAHIHGPATTEQFAGVLVGIDSLGVTPLAASGRYSGSVTLTAEQILNLLDGLTYLNIHTGLNTGGEIRGQITP
jgi:hypothetical protein